MIRLQVIGVPAPQGSKRAFIRGGKPRMIDGSSDSGKASMHAWRQAVATAARDWLAEHPQQPLAGPVSVSIEFSFAPTKSDPYRFWHTTIPDLDKVLRSTFDALKDGGLIVDDRLVCRVTATKAYCNPGQPAGCEIGIVCMAEQEQLLRADRKRAAAERRAKAAS